MYLYVTYLHLGKSELEELELILRVLGTPTIDSYPGMNKLPLYNTFLANMKFQTNIFHTYYGSVLGADTRELLLEYIFHLCPVHRSTAAEILSQHCFRLLPPADPALGEVIPDLSLVQLYSSQAGGSNNSSEILGGDALVSHPSQGSLYHMDSHEFQTKKRLREERRLQAAAAALAAEEAGTETGMEVEVGVGDTNAPLEESAQGTVSQGAVMESIVADGSSAEDSPITIPSFEMHRAAVSIAGGSASAGKPRAARK